MATRQNYFIEGVVEDGVWPATGYDNSYNIYSADDKFSQNFIPAVDYVVESVRLPLARVGTPGTVTVGIYAVDGAFKPTGTVLASGTTSGNTLTEDYGWTWRTITLTTNPTLSASTEYAIVLSCAAADESNFVYWWMNDGTVPITSLLAAQRRSFRSQNGGATWLLLSTLTACNYEVYDNYSFSPPVGMPTKRRLIAAAHDKIWYEDV